MVDKVSFHLSMQNPPHPALPLCERSGERVSRTPSLDGRGKGEGGSRMRLLSPVPLFLTPTDLSQAIRTNVSSMIEATESMSWKLTAPTGIRKRTRESSDPA